MVKNNKLILTTRQRFKSERHNVFTQKINKTRLSSNDYKRMQSIDSIETNAYGTNKDLICKEERLKPNNKKNNTIQKTIQKYYKQRHERI